MSQMNKLCRAAIAGLVLMLAGCATTPGAGSDPRDPLAAAVVVDRARARTDPQAKGSRGISIFAVERGTPTGIQAVFSDEPSKFAPGVPTAKSLGFNVVSGVSRGFGGGCCRVVPALGRTVCCARHGCGAALPGMGD